MENEGSVEDGVEDTETKRMKKVIRILRKKQSSL